MAIYLIDYENVNMDGLNGIQDLSEADEVYIFYSDNANKLTFSLHQQIVESPGLDPVCQHGDRGQERPGLPAGHLSGLSGVPEQR